MMAFSTPPSGFAVVASAVHGNLGRGYVPSAQFSWPCADGASRGRDLPIGGDGYDLLGIAGAFYLAPYLLFEIILRGEPDWLRNPRSGLLAGGIVVLVLAAQQLGIFGLANEVTVLQLPAAIAGMAGAVFLLQRFPKNALLTRIGYYSYTISLLSG